jgi:predicted amidohydrolase
MSALNVFLIQTALNWENPAANRARLQWHMSQTMSNSLVVLPEMFSTGFTMNPESFAETMDGETVQWMKALSADRMICGSVAVVENGKFFNRFIAVYQGSVVAQYNKRHLFTYGGEHNHYELGDEPCVFQFQGWEIAPFICYDLRFPAWIRKTVLQDRSSVPQCLLFVANWPSVRIAAWDALLKARAIENQAYVVGVNRLGNDGHGVAHNGHSQVLRFDGDYLLSPYEKEGVAHVVLEKGPLENHRAKFPFLLDADGF